VVFLHAATGSSRVWDYQIPAFRMAGYRFIAFDRRGWGRTVSKARGPQASTAADDLLGLLDHLSIERAHLVGTAAGGSVALDFALSFPQRLRSLVIANAIGGVQDQDFLELGRRLRPPQFDARWEVFGLASPWIIVFSSRGCRMIGCVRVKALSAISWVFVHVHLATGLVGDLLDGRANLFAQRSELAVHHEHAVRTREDADGSALAVERIEIASQLRGLDLDLAEVGLLRIDEGRHESHCRQRRKHKVNRLFHDYCASIMSLSALRTSGNIFITLLRDGLPFAVHRTIPPVHGVVISPPNTSGTT
jgi:pimeloyl-ACP methyl ester carboxylesterase